MSSQDDYIVELLQLRNAKSKVSVDDLWRENALLKSELNSVYDELDALTDDEMRSRYRWAKNEDLRTDAFIAAEVARIREEIENSYKTQVEILRKKLHDTEEQLNSLKKDLGVTKLAEERAAIAREAAHVRSSKSMLESYVHSLRRGIDVATRQYTSSRGEENTARLPPKEREALDAITVMPMAASPAATVAKGFSDLEID